MHMRGSVDHRAERLLERPIQHEDAAGGREKANGRDECDERRGRRLVEGVGSCGDSNEHRPSWRGLSERGLSQAFARGGGGNEFGRLIRLLAPHAMYFTESIYMTRSTIPG